MFAIQVQSRGMIVRPNGAGKHIHMNINAFARGAVVARTENIMIMFTYLMVYVGGGRAAFIIIIRLTVVICVFMCKLNRCDVRTGCLSVLYKCRRYVG